MPYTVPSAAIFSSHYRKRAVWEITEVGHLKKHGENAVAAKTVLIKMCLEGKRGRKKKGGQSLAWSSEVELPK